MRFASTAWSMVVEGANLWRCIIQTNLLITLHFQIAKMSVTLNETNTIVDRMVNFFVEHEDLRTKVGIQSWQRIN